MTINETVLAEALISFANRLTEIERTLANVGFREPSEPKTPAGAIPAYSTERLQAFSRVDEATTARAAEQQPEPNWAPLPTRSLADDRQRATPIPPGHPAHQRPEPPSLPRSGVARESDGLGSGAIAASNQSRPGVDFMIEGSGRYSRAPIPDKVAVSGTEFIHCVSDEYVQVRTTDGRLLGAIPTFAADITQVFTQLGQILQVGMLAARAVVVPYNTGIDPYTIQGFIPAPGVQRGDLTTGQIGYHANMNNQDIGSRI